MTAPRSFLVALMMGALLALVGCVQPLERINTETPTALPESTPVPTLTPTSTPTSEPVAALIPTPTATATPSTEDVSSADQGFLLEVHGPADGTTVRSNAVVVYGVTSPDAVITINDELAIVDETGQFQAEVVLEPGLNTLNVFAVDGEGESKSHVLTVTAQPLQAFLLLITEPEDQSIVVTSPVRLAGRTGPDAVLTVNGVGITVDDLGFFSTSVQLDPGPNLIDVVATNVDGKVLSTVLAIIYRE